MPHDLDSTSSSHDAAPAPRSAAERRTEQAGRQAARRRRDRALIIAVCVGSFAAGAASGAAPTGTAVVDPILAGSLAALTAASGTIARRWTWVVAAGTATVLAVDLRWGLISAAALALAGVSAALDLRSRLLGAVVCAVAAQGLLHLSDFGWHGSSALLGTAAGATVCASAYQQARRHTRRWARRALRATALVVVLAGLAAAVAMLDARASASRGLAQARSGLDDLRAGDVESANAQLAAASSSFDAAEQALEGPLALPARAVPLLAQQVSAARGIAGVGASITGTAESTTRDAVYQDLRMAQGRVDVVRLAAMHEPLDEAVGALLSAQDELGDVSSDWLVPLVRTELERLEEEVAGILPETQLAAAAARELPAMLGAEGPRRYVILFGQPAEARFLGGFVGSYGELVASDGEVDLARSGTISELVGAPGERTLTVSPEFLERYGRFDPARWVQNITASPDFPSVAAAMREIYPQAADVPIDGVIYVDPFGLAALLELTGPVELEGLDFTLDASNAAEFLLRDQYLLFDDDDDQEEVLAEATEAVFEALLARDLPSPRRLGEVLGPAVASGHLLFTTYSDDSVALLDRLGTTGRFPAPEGEDWLSVRVSNASANKIEAFLEQEQRYDVTVDPATGEVTGTVTVRLRNTAPAEGLPRVVIGNSFGGPPGTNRLLVSVFTPLELAGAQLDGTSVSVEPQVDFGGNVYSLLVEIPPGGESELQLELTGRVDTTDGYHLTLSPQPLANRPVTVVDIRATSGGVAEVNGAERDGDRVRRSGELSTNETIIARFGD